jgi:starvation-inducible outer membrane lipoprotein
MQRVLLFLTLSMALLLAGCTHTLNGMRGYPPVRIQDTTDTNAPVFQPVP